MPVLVSAVLDHGTVKELLAELLPLTIDLGDDEHKDRWIQIDPPQLLEFEEGRGVRIQTGAKLQWTVAGVAIPFTVQMIRFLLSPVIDRAQGRVNLLITLEETDLKNVPRMIDRGVVGQLNARLSARPDVIGWNFARTLAVRLPLPEAMAPLDHFEMDAGELSIEVGADALRVHLPLPMRFSRHAP